MTGSTHPTPVVARAGYVFLRDGRMVEQAFYDAVLHAVEASIPALIPRAQYTARMLCGEDVWATLKPGQPSLAGRCLADIVDRGLLPLVPVKGAHEYPCLYRLA